MASNASVATEAIFTSPALRPVCENLLVGEPPKTRRFAPYASQSLTLLFLLSARLRVAQQIVNVGLDGRDLLHIRLGFAVLGVEFLFLCREIQDRIKNESFII